MNLQHEVIDKVNKQITIKFLTVLYNQLALMGEQSVLILENYKVFQENEVRLCSLDLRTHRSDS